jgi:hypothetical protein
MSFYRVATLGVLASVAAMGLAGCQSTSKALGMSKVVPDEFRVVTKAPLVVPPDYSLRPPAPGEPRPQELQPESAARQALIGQSNAAGRSDGEKLLVSKAGVDKADPLIRFVVDDENGDLAHKDEGFSQKVMFWKKGDKTAAPTAVRDRRHRRRPGRRRHRRGPPQGLTGNGTIVITREKESKIKLPGL